jgi:hypothetical protein
MNENLIPYIKEEGSYGILHYKKLNFTGNYKICFTKHGNEILYIQHKTCIPFIKFWINENNIEFLLPEKEIIFNTNK